MTIGSKNLVYFLMEKKMRNNLVKKLSQTLAVCLSATALFCSNQSQIDDCIYSDIVEATLAPKPCVVWYVKVNKEHAEAQYGGSINATIDQFGKLNVFGKSKYIGETEKRKLVQLVSMLKLVKGAHTHFSDQFIKQLLESYAECPCWLDPTTHSKK